MFQLGDYGVGSFNGFDLKRYYNDDKLQNLRANSSLEGEDDAPMGDQVGEPKGRPNMCKRCSQLRGNTKKVKDYLSRIYTARAANFSPWLPNQWLTWV